jgi:hypothetical protein
VLRKVQWSNWAARSAAMEVVSETNSYANADFGK